MTRSLNASLATFALLLVLVVMPACGGTSGKVAISEAADAAQLAKPGTDRYASGRRRFPGYRQDRRGRA